MIHVAATVRPPHLRELPLAGHEAERCREVTTYDGLPMGLARLTILAREAAGIADVPIALVCLMTESVQRVVAAAGVEPSVLPRSDALCRHVIGEQRTVHVADASLDPRWAGNPYVDGRRACVRFYGSHPLVASTGLTLDTLCLFDVRPRTLTPEQVSDLDDLAVRVVKVLEDWRSAVRAA